jgi:hypothetical protein
MWPDSTKTARRIMDNSIKRHPALVLIAGDFVYPPSEDEPADVERDEFLAFDDEINDVVELVRPLVEGTSQFMPYWEITITACRGQPPQITSRSPEPSINHLKPSAFACSITRPYR